MTVHITARLAWHSDGWNGRICKQPDCNTYCIGNNSYPGDTILKERNLELEVKNAGKLLADLPDNELPPCIQSINAFGSVPIKGYSNPPDFFRNEADRTFWEIPESTVCIWPFEEMYSENVLTEDGFYNHDQRARNVEEYMEKIEPEKSLIFYYANYSNPLSEDEESRYIIVGVSRISNVGKRLNYENCSEAIRDKYAEGMLWARNITSFYPDEGLRIPYHNYLNDQEILQKIAVYPENTSVCKYATRHITDDDAIGLIEQILYSVDALIEIGDQTENWEIRKEWLQKRIAELWRKRGPYPGLLNVAQSLAANSAIDPLKQMINDGKSQEAYELFFDSIENQKESIELNLTESNVKQISRNWKLQSDSIRDLLKNLFPRFEITPEQIQHVIDSENDPNNQHGLPHDISILLKNPYLLCETYVGDFPEDKIPWGIIDRGVIPSPELGIPVLSEMLIDDPRRLRALCVESLQRDSKNTFVLLEDVISQVNNRLSFLPVWKQAKFTDRHFEVDYEVLDESLEVIEKNNKKWVYLKKVYEDERLVENTFRKIINRTDISFQKPFSKENWSDEMVNEKSPLYTDSKAKEEYLNIIDAQSTTCSNFFNKPFVVIKGAAGTGKTSLICAIIKAVRQTSSSSSVTILAPTGKASDRVRAKLEEREIGSTKTSTIHSFLASGGWLNENLTFKRSGGSDIGEGTLILDESSMIDLSLVATLIRSVNWKRIQRLILVGDPNQLPPIGRGRFFVDTIEWLQKNHKNNIVTLEHNLRQLENKVNNQGTSIIDTANLFIGGEDTEGEEDRWMQTSDIDEQLIAKIHIGGIVDKDLQVEYWDDPADLPKLLIEIIEKDMKRHVSEELGEEEANQKIDPENPYTLWRSAYNWKPEKYQLLSPHRGELYGIDSLNLAVQEYLSEKLINRIGKIDGITLYDKVMQIHNRSISNPLSAYNSETRSLEKAEIFNGEIGFVVKNKQSNGWRKLSNFNVKFERKEHLSVKYGKFNNMTENVGENLALAYAISIHKSQGSEFENTYVIVPKTSRLLMSELLYTAITRAKKHCTILVQGDISTLLSVRRRENFQKNLINSSLFEGIFRVVPPKLINRSEWYEEGLIHKSLSDEMVRSKSELVIANLLHSHEIPFEYEKMLRADDGTIFLPDFTITIHDKTWYWEHWGMMSEESYKKHRDIKIDWYNKHFPDQLIETFEGENLSQVSEKIINDKFNF